MQLRFDWWRWLVTILVGFFIMSIAQTKKEYIEKDLEGWDLFYWKFGMISFWVVSLTLVAMIFFLTVKYKKKFFH